MKDDQFLIDTKLYINLGNDNSADTLTEYDAIIFNFINPVSPNGIRFKQLLKFLALENKLLIFLLNRYVNQNGIENINIITELLGKYSGKAQSFIDTKASGSLYTLTERGRKSIVNNYLNTASTNWKISFYDIENKIIQPLATNTEDNFVAFSFEHESIKADNYFIPWNPDAEKLLWNTIKNYLLYRDNSFNIIDEWVTHYSFPQLDDTNKNIQEKQKKIDKVEEEKSKLEIIRQRYERIRNTLLYYDGDLLKVVCKEVLIEIGIKTEDGKQGREDLVFIHNDEHFLIEVKGTEKSASKTHIRQLNSHVTEYRDENEVSVKGILLSNCMA